MNNAELYSISNSVQKNDAKYIIEQYFHLIRWRPDGKDRILDIGCGSGDVTAYLLLPNVPISVELIVGTDISEQMIKHARATIQNPRLKFEISNIATNRLPDHLINNFDHLISFYCLHWVQNQRKAFQNMHSLLRKNGDLLVTFLGTNPIYLVYEAVAALPKWKPYMMDVESFISPYQHRSDPVQDIHKMLHDIGFAVDLCNSEKRSCLFENINVWRNTVTAINPFMDRIPNEMKEEYMNEYLTQIKKLGFVEINNNSFKITTTYDMITIYATKR